MEIAMNHLGILRRLGQKLGPYLMLELLLPGGTLIALLLFVWQRAAGPAPKREPDGSRLP